MDVYPFFFMNKSSLTITLSHDFMRSYTCFSYGCSCLCYTWLNLIWTSLPMISCMVIRVFCMVIHALDTNNFFFVFMFIHLSIWAFITRYPTCYKQLYVPFIQSSTSHRCLWPSWWIVMHILMHNHSWHMNLNFLCLSRLCLY